MTIFRNTPPTVPPYVPSEKGEYPVISGAQHVSHKMRFWANSFVADVETFFSDLESDEVVIHIRKEYEADGSLLVRPDDDLDALYKLIGLLVDMRSGNNNPPPDSSTAHTDNSIDTPPSEQVSLVANVLDAAVDLYEFAKNDPIIVSETRYRGTDWYVTVPLSMMLKLQKAMSSLMNRGSK